jgi:hypothetical protein
MALTQTDKLFELADLDERRKNLATELLQSLAPQSEQQPTQVAFLPSVAKRIVSDAAKEFVKAGRPQKLFRRLSYLATDLARAAKTPMGEHQLLKDIEYVGRLKLPGEAMGRVSTTPQGQLRLELAAPLYEYGTLWTLPHELAHAYQGLFPESIRLLQEVAEKIPDEVGERALQETMSFLKRYPRLSEADRTQIIEWMHEPEEIFANWVAQKVHERLFGSPGVVPAYKHRSGSLIRYFEEADPRVTEELNRAIEILSTR